MASKLEELMAKRAAAKAAATGTPAPTESKAEALKAEVDSLPKALVEASKEDKVNPPESAAALPASMGVAEPPPAEEPKAKGRGKGRAAKAADATPATEEATFEGTIVSASIVGGEVSGSISFKGVPVPVGARVRIEVLG